MSLIFVSQCDMPYKLKKPSKPSNSLILWINIKDARITTHIWKGIYWKKLTSQPIFEDDISIARIMGYK